MLKILAGTGRNGTFKVVRVPSTDKENRHSYAGKRHRSVSLDHSSPTSAMHDFSKTLNKYGSLDETPGK